MKSIIYGLIDNETLELRYIGQTVKPLAARFKQHMRFCSPNVHLNNWLHSADVSAIVLERDPENLNEAEMCWIADMRAAGARLLNMTDGGGGTNGRKYTVETCAKISARAVDRRHSVETRIKMSAAHVGRIPTAETRAKMSAAQKGHKYTIETRTKISAAMKGKQNSLGYKHTTETRSKLSAAKIGNTYARRA